MDMDNCTSKAGCRGNGDLKVDMSNNTTFDGFRSNCESSDICKENQSLHFQSLPHVVLLKILSNLNVKDLGRTACVSKHLNSYCKYPALWTVVDLSNRKMVDDFVLQRVINISRNITILNVSEADNVTEFGLRQALLGCKTLIEFRAARSYFVSDECLNAIGQTCKHLKRVDLTMCRRITDSGIGQLCSGCRNLEKIKIDSCIQLKNESLVHIANNCRKLKMLTIENNKNMNDIGVEALVSKCNQLERLQLNSCGISGTSIDNIAMHLHAISMLDVRCCVTLNDDTVYKLVQNCKNLVILNLSLCFNVTDISLEHICGYCTQLKSVYLVHCKITDKGLKTLSSGALGLQWIDVSWCQEITDEGVRALVQGCKTLEHLGIIRCDRVTNETIHELCLRYPSVYISSFITEMDRFLKKTDGNAENNGNQQEEEQQQQQ